MKAQYRQRIYRTGAVIEVEETYPTRYGDLLTRKKRKKPTPEAIKHYNEEQAIRKLTRIINENFNPEDWFLTLHYENHNRPKTLSEAEEKISYFMRKLRVLYKRYNVEFKYVRRTAFGERGAVHHHIVLPKGVPIREINRLWLDFVKATLGARPPEYRSLYDTGEYSSLAAYIVKQKSADGLYTKKWISSRNLKRPLPEKDQYIEKIKWNEPPVARAGYYIDTDSIRAGCNPINGRPYLFYRMIKFPPNFICYDDDGNRLTDKAATKYFREKNKQWLKTNWAELNPEGEIVFRKDVETIRKNE